MPVNQPIKQFAPPGKVAPFAQVAAPAGWLACDGQAVSRATYAALFAAIGTLYGAGNGSTTFNLPDYRGEFLRGVDGGRGVDAGRTMGSAQGSANLSHGHGISIDAVGDHVHPIQIFNLDGPNTDYPNGIGGGASGTASVAIKGGGAHSHTATVADAGGTESRPRNVAVLYCIKT